MNVPLILYVNDAPAEPDEPMQRLIRSVIISLFSWRRADADDVLPADRKEGWWGDVSPNAANDRIGSKLWLLARGKLNADTVAKAKEYTEQSLQWLLDDGVATAVTVETERQGIDRLAVGITIARDDAEATIRFADVWDYLRA